MSSGKLGLAGEKHPVSYLFSAERSLAGVHQPNIHYATQKEAVPRQCGGPFV